MFQSSLKNRTVFCRDSLEVLRGIDSESIDLVYLDPPFNNKKTLHASIGSKSEGADFKDTWRDEDIKDEWVGRIADEYSSLSGYLNGIERAGDRSNKYYLVFMAMRLIELKRILKVTGSVYLHCDQTMSHYIKVLMDVIFGHNNFRNEIVWAYRTGGISKRYFPHKHDTLLSYGKEFQRSFHDPLQERIYYEKPFIDTEQDEDGRYYADVYIRDVWNDVKPIINVSKERVGYPTQKPLVLMERIIKASSREGDVVLDPFCGCATTCVAAEKLGREWIGIDVGKKAFDLVKVRLKKEVADVEKLTDWGKKVIFREDIPDRTDLKVGGLEQKVDVKHELYGLQRGYCAGCKEHFQFRNLEVDHIVARTKGGGEAKENKQLLCGHCNRVKGGESMEYLFRKLREYGILKD